MSNLERASLKSSATVKQARLEIGRALNQADPQEQLRMLNHAREWAYANQRPLGLDLSVSLCVSVECLCEACPTCEDKPYIRGFRLPLRFQSVEAARHNSTHVTPFSRWRIPYDGVSGFPNDGSVNIFDRGWSPIERDFSGCQPQKIRFWAEGCEECQDMEITGLTHEDRQQTFRFTVKRDPQVTDVVFKRISSVKFANGVSGTVILAEEDGRELARYETGESAPQFREYHVVGSCIPSQLIISANCSYANLTDDFDIVEFGNPLVWQTLARYLQLLNKSDKDGNDRANMDNYLRTATALMQESSAVDLGNSIGGRIRRASMKGKRLSSEYHGARRR